MIGSQGPTSFMENWGISRIMVTDHGIIIGGNPLARPVQRNGMVTIQSTTDAHCVEYFYAVVSRQNARSESIMPSEPDQVLIFHRRSCVFPNEWALHEWPYSTIHD